MRPHSQPLMGLPSQLNVPVAQEAIAHALPTQAKVALVAVGHDVSQAPQWATSDDVDVSHPSLGSLLQSP
jgi:hypothetical protein